MNLYKRGVSHSKEQDIDDSQNPWAGLASYEDPETAEKKLKFCGRDDDSYDLARLIMGNVFVTLYGKSGIGKTSLLNAGVFPELREEQFTPVSIRLGMRDEEHPQNFQTMIVEAVERVVKRTETFNVIDEQQDQQSIDYLWNYFARHRFYDKDDEPTTHVIVFDQFEEVFRGYRNEAETLLRQLDYLNDKDHSLGSCKVDGQSYRYELNFRFVASIREDDLYLLEDSIDNCYLPSLKRCRYRLRSLSKDGARDAILIPGERLFNASEKDSIAETIISKSRNDDGSICTNIISLLCSRIYVEFKKSSANHISPSLIENFIKGNPFERFYNEATKGLSNREKSYIEDNLVDSTGRRNSIPESNFLNHVPKGAALLEGDTRILQRTGTSSNGKNNRVELIHDSFCEPLSKQKEKRDKRKRLLQLISACIISILSVSAVVYVWNINHQMRANESRVISEKASALVDKGDSYLASLLALEALPPNRPYTIEAESALRKALQYENAILRGHTYSVRFASFSNDSKYIVSASYDNTVRIWDVKTGQQVCCLEGHIGVVKSASFSPDGKYIVSASYDNTVRIWDTKTGQQVGSPIEGLTDEFKSASYSSNGKYVVVESYYGQRIWDAKTGQEVSNLEGDTDYIYSVSFSPDDNYVLARSYYGEYNKVVRIWDTKTGQLIGCLEGHTGSVYSASYSPDGKYIVSASSDNTVRIWDAKTRQQVGCLLGGVASAFFSHDGKHVVSINYNTVRIWNTKTGQQVGCLEGHKNNISSASFSPDGKYIVSVSDDNTIRIWNTITGQQEVCLEGHSDVVNSASFSPDGKYIVSASYDNTVRIWDTKTRQQVGCLLEGHNGWGLSASFSPDGKYIVSASNDDTVRIWDAKTGLQVGNLEGHTDAVYSASFSPDGKHIVSASLDQTVRIWDVKTGQQVGYLEGGHTGWGLSVSFSPDGNYIASAFSDQTVRIWDVKTGLQVGNLEGQSSSFSPDGKYIVSASNDNTVRIWDAKTGQQMDSSLEGHTNGVYSASFSPDGKKIVSASLDNTVRIWDAKTGQQKVCIEGHTDDVNSASFSPDGKYIVSASNDNTVRIWDAKTGQQVGSPLEGHTDDVYSAFFSPDGKYIVSASKDNTVRIWYFPPLHELIDSTRERFKNRPLTTEERQKYYLE